MFNALWRPVKECRTKVLTKLCSNLILRGAARMRQFERQKGNFPAFLMISLTNRCNLSCRGCWVSKSNPPQELSREQIFQIIRTAKEKHGSYFFGLLGGEPFLYPHLWDIFAEFPDCYFQLFTNGHFLNRENAERLAKFGNVTPLISVEGLPEESNRRRNGEDVFERSIEAIKNCNKAGLFTGVASSITRKNLNDLASREFIKQLAAHGAHYFWYYISINFQKGRMNELQQVGKNLQ